MAYHHTRSRRGRRQHVGTVEMLCVLVVLASLVFLVSWIVSQAGGGHLMF